MRVPATGAVCAPVVLSDDAQRRILAKTMHIMTWRGLRLAEAYAIALSEYEQNTQ